MKYGFTVGVLILALLHLIWPNLGIDSITVALLFIASLPWVGPILKGLAYYGVRNLELPGGIKIELTDIKAATDKVTRGHAVVTGHATVSAKGHKVSQSEEDSFSYIREISKADSNLSLVAFRIEIEKRIRRLAKELKLTDNRSLQQTIQLLHNNEALPTEASSGLIEIIALGNRAAHGVEVSNEAAAWVLDVGPSIILELDEIIKSKSHTTNKDR